MALITLPLSCHPQICAPFLPQTTQTLLMWKMFISSDCAFGLSSLILFFRIFSGMRQPDPKTSPMMWENHWFVQWQNSSLFSTSLPVFPNTWVTFQAAARHQPSVAIDQLILVTKVFSSESFWSPVKFHQGLQGYSVFSLSGTYCLRSIALEQETRRFCNHVNMSGSFCMEWTVLPETFIFTLIQKRQFHVFLTVLRKFFFPAPYKINFNYTTSILILLLPAI